MYCRRIDVQSDHAYASCSAEKDFLHMYVIQRLSSNPRACKMQKAGDTLRLLFFVRRVGFEPTKTEVNWFTASPL